MKTLAVAALTWVSSTLVAVASAEPSVQLKRGTELFAQRCVLCHGRDGLGEGALPLALKNYPDTNLATARVAKDAAALRKIIVDGGSKGAVSIEMPPWGDELAAAEIDDLTAFVAHLRSEPESAGDLLRRIVKEERPSAQLGGKAYAAYCALCHGAAGEGNGKMAKVIKDPPPFNLTKSTADEAAMMKIIAAGGEAVGRSPRMPPWGQQLSGTELISIIMYIKSFRR